MAKSRTCPHCKRPLPLGEGFRYDDKLNLICGFCHKIIVPVDRASESIASVTSYHPGYAGGSAGGVPRCATQQQDDDDYGGMM